MYGKLIGISIAVDCLHKVVKNGIYFLTEGQIENPLPNHVDIVYTSPYNAQLLKKKLQIDSDTIVGLPLNKKLLIQDKIKNLDFNVTLLSAHQKPGAVMFLFEGNEIGNILYAGKCCYSENFFGRPLSNVLKVKVLDYLYVHDVCEDCHAHSVSVTSAVERVLSIVRKNPSSKVLILEPCFREDILTTLRDKLNKKIGVSENIMTFLKEVNETSDFVLDEENVKIVDTENLLESKKSHEGLPTVKVILIPCSMKMSSQEIKLKRIKLENKGYHVILYRNHCSQPELVNLVRDINAKYNVLVRPSHREGYPPAEKVDLDCWSHVDINSCIDFFNYLGKTNEQQQVTSNIEEMDVEILNPVECIENIDVIETIDCSDDERLEAATPTSFILIESDIASIASKETVPNPALSSH